MNLLTVDVTFWGNNWIYTNLCRYFCRFLLLFVVNKNRFKLPHFLEWMERSSSLVSLRKESPQLINSLFRLLLREDDEENKNFVYFHKIKFAEQKKALLNWTLKKGSLQLLLQTLFCVFRVSCKKKGKQVDSNHHHHDLHL